jgi:photosystem II stability/assembly factor-like uncharacterized protein
MFRIQHLLLLLFCLLNLELSAQWKKIYVNFNNDLFDLQQVPDRVFAVGQGSTVIKSADSGKSWTKMPLTIPSNLRTVYFFDSLTGLVSGENARIQKTYNGGKTWSQKYVRTAAYTYDMTFAGNKGIAVGKDLLAISSTDAGETWTVDTTPLVRKQLNSVCISQGGYCWTVGDSGFVFKKHINEKKWQQVFSGTDINLTSVSAIGDDVIIIVGGMPDTAKVGKHLNILLYSSDSGKTWLRTSLPELKTVYSSYFFNSDTGFICGTNGIISKCYQVFNERSQQLSGTATALNKIEFFRNNGLAIGDGGTILRTNNRGGFGLSIPSLQLPSINLYPNPNKGHFYINAGNHNISQISAIDQSGKSVQVVYIDGAYSIIGSSKGIYHLQILLENGQMASSTIEIQ